MSVYNRPVDSHRPSPTRGRYLSLNVELGHLDRPVRRILFTGASTSHNPHTFDFSERVLVWERDRERADFARWYKGLDSTSPDSFLHLLPNQDPASWNLGFDLSSLLNPVRRPDHPLDRYGEPITPTESYLNDENLLLRFPDSLDKKSYPGPYFISIVGDDGWWDNPSFIGNVYRWNEPDVIRQAPYAFWVADCYDPPVYVIFAESEEEAYEQAKDWFSVYDPGFRIEEPVYADHLSDSTSPFPSEFATHTPTPVSVRAFYQSLVALGPDHRDEALTFFHENYEGSYDYWGNPIDDESLQMAPLRILSIDWE